MPSSVLSPDTSQVPTLSLRGGGWDRRRRFTDPRTDRHPGYINPFCPRKSWKEWCKPLLTTYHDRWPPCDSPQRRGLRTPFRRRHKNSSPSRPKLGTLRPPSRHRTSSFILEPTQNDVCRIVVVVTVVSDHEWDGTRSSGERVTPDEFAKGFSFYENRVEKVSDVRLPLQNPTLGLVLKTRLKHYKWNR